MEKAVFAFLHLDSLTMVPASRSCEEQDRSYGEQEFHQEMEFWSGRGEIVRIKRPSCSLTSLINDKRKTTGNIMGLSLLYQQL